MDEQLICPRCGAPNAPSSTSCYYCGWSPSATQQEGGQPQDGAGTGRPGPGYGGVAGAGGYSAGGYEAGGYGSGGYGGSGPDNGGYGPDNGGYGQSAGSPGSAGGYGAGAYGAAGYGAGSYGADGYGSGYGGTADSGFPAGPGNTEVRSTAGGPIGPGGTAGGATAAAASGPDRSKLMIMIGAIGGGLVVIAVVVFVILKFVVPPGNGQVAGPGGVSPSTGTGTSAPGSAGPSGRPSPTASPTPSVTPPPDYTKIAGTVKDGVLKVFATACGNDGTRIGSAFLVDHDTAVASYASLAGAQVIVVSNGSENVPAEVDAVDTDHGIVVLKLDRSLDGHVFAIDSKPPKAKDPVGFLAVSSTGSSPTLKTSRITATSQAARVGGDKVTGLAATGLDPEDGWSGGPTLTEDGKANGMVFTGPGTTTAMIVPGSVIKKAATGGGELPGGSCSNPHGPDVTVIGGKPSKDLKKTLQAYFGGINSGDYRQAYNQLGPNSNGGPFSSYVEGWQTVYDHNIQVRSESGSGDGMRAHVTFTAMNSPEKGPKGHESWTCTNWDMEYQFIKDGDHLLIDKLLRYKPSAC